MPRTGMNPLRNAKAPSFIRDIVCLVVTHLPDFEGYHEERFEIVKACLTSMRNNIGRTNTFYVFDNGSHDVFREWLYNDFKPDLLTFSHNIGKFAARTTAIQSLPLESIVCYSDDDMLFYPNWLQPQLDLLNNFPNVSAVSGYPVRTSFRWGNKNALQWANSAKNVTIETGRFIPDDYEKDFAESIGRNWEEHKETSAHDMDIKITYNKYTAFLTAHHCQFIGYAAKLFRVLGYNQQAMGSEINFDNRLDEVGLRLCTIERTCRHMGNHIDEKLRQEINEVMRYEKAA